MPTIRQPRKKQKCMTPEERKRRKTEAKRAQRKREKLQVLPDPSSAVARAGYGNVSQGVLDEERASLGGTATKARGNIAQGLALCALAKSDFEPIAVPNDSFVGGVPKAFLEKWSAQASAEATSARSTSASASASVGPSSEVELGARSSASASASASTGVVCESATNDAVDTCTGKSTCAGTDTGDIVEEVQAKRSVPLDDDSDSKKIDLIVVESSYFISVGVDNGQIYVACR